MAYKAKVRTYSGNQACGCGHAAMNEAVYGSYSAPFCKKEKCMRDAITRVVEEEEATRGLGHHYGFGIFGTTD